MRLRYLHLQNYPPIKEIDLCFASSSPLGRECAIRFVVGVNGSGKSNLLRALAELFLALEDKRTPPFPITLVYELGKRGTSSHYTFVVDFPGGKTKAAIWVADKWHWPDEIDKEAFRSTIDQLRTQGELENFRPHIAPGTWPQDASIALPKAVLAYTTGNLTPWQSVWNRNQDGEGLLENEEGDIASNDERPAGWNAADERLYQSTTSEPQTDGLYNTAESKADNLYRRPILLDATLLKCALLAVTLPHSLRETSQRTNALTDLLGRGGWHHLVCVNFRAHLQTQEWLKHISQTAYQWWQCAGDVISEPHPMEKRRSLYFDINAPLNPIEDDKLNTANTQGEALRQLLGDEKASPYELFLKLLELNQAGLFDDLLLRLRRQASPEDRNESSETDVGVLRYDELSDGEQMVLGRMALFHLLDGQQDALLLLDEPETHFNDKWKREIVDIIDDAIGETTNDVLVSTHSAIVLSDVFNNEVVMVEKTADGSIIRDVNEPTFATDPSALMMTVFGAEDSIGKRAQEYIENKLSQSKGSPEEIADLEKLISRMGSGFYRSELRTLLNTWRADA